MLVQALIDLTRPSRALSCLALLLCILLQLPMFVFWIFLGQERRTDALRMAALLVEWAGVIVGGAEGEAVRSRRPARSKAPPQRVLDKDPANPSVGPASPRPPRSSRAKAGSAGA